MNQANSFTLDMLGVSPHKLRKNLNKIAEIDSVFRNASLINRNLKKGKMSKNDVVKFTEKMNEPMKFLFALNMYRKADLLEKQRKEISGNELTTIGIDYNAFINDIGDKLVIGAIPIDAREDPEFYGFKQLIRLIRGQSYFPKWLDPSGENDELWKDKKQVRMASENIKKIKKLWKRMAKGTKSENRKIKGYITNRFKRLPYPPTDFLVSKLFGEKVKRMEKKRKREREAKKSGLWESVKAVAKVAIKAAKIIPGVGDAIEAAETAVKEIPGLKDALKLADKVKKTVKKAKKIVDTKTLEKVKDLGLNKDVRKALAVDKLVQNTVKDVVKRTKIKKASDLVQTVEELGPPKIKAAISLVKAAREMDPTAIAKVKNIQALADSGVLAARKALESMHVAIKIQNTAKQQALSKERQWIYY
jgi:hypothetical protein